MYDNITVPTSENKIYLYHSSWQQNYPIMLLNVYNFAYIPDNVRML